LPGSLLGRTRANEAFACRCLKPEPGTAGSDTCKCLKLFSKVPIWPPKKDLRSMFLGLKLILMQYVLIVAEVLPSHIFTQPVEKSRTQASFLDH